MEKCLRMHVASSMSWMRSMLTYWRMWRCGYLVWVTVASLTIIWLLRSCMLDLRSWEHNWHLWLWVMIRILSVTWQLGRTGALSSGRAQVWRSLRLWVCLQATMLWRWRIHPHMCHVVVFSLEMHNWFLWWRRCVWHLRTMSATSCISVSIWIRQTFVMRLVTPWPSIPRTQRPWWVHSVPMWIWIQRQLYKSQVRVRCYETSSLV